MVLTNDNEVIVFSLMDVLSPKMSKFDHVLRWKMDRQGFLSSLGQYSNINQSIWSDSDSAGRTHPQYVKQLYFPSYEDCDDEKPTNDFQSPVVQFKLLNTTFDRYLILFQNG